MAPASSGPFRGDHNILWSEGEKGRGARPSPEGRPLRSEPRKGWNTNMAIAPQRTAIGIRRYFTTEGVHPYDELVWERRDSRITDYRDGSVAFEQLDVEVPATWSLNATNILAQKYFRGTPGTPEREWSLRQVADRVADTITDWGVKDGYFVDVAE